MTTNDFLILFLVFSNILLIIYCSVIFFQVYIRDRNTKEDNTDNPTQVKKTASGTQHLMEDPRIWQRLITLLTLCCKVQRSNGRITKPSSLFQGGPETNRGSRSTQRP